MSEPITLAELRAYPALALGDEVLALIEVAEAANAYLRADLMRDNELLSGSARGTTVGMADDAEDRLRAALSRFDFGDAA